MRFTLFSLLFLIASYAALAQNSQIAEIENDESLPPVIQDALLSLFGFLNGSEVLNQIPEAATCVLDSQDLKTAAIAAVADFKNFTPSSIAAGITTLSNAISAEISDCGNTAEETATLLQGLYGNLTNETYDENGLYNLINNYQQVINDLSQAYGDFSSDSWLNLGDSVGNIAGLFLYDAPSSVAETSYTIWPMNNNTLPVDVQDAVQVLEGVIQGLNLTLNVTELPICVTAVENFTVIVEEVNSLLNNGSAQDVQEAIALLAGSFQLLGQIEYSCQDSWTQLETYLVQFAQDFSNSSVDEQGLLDLVLNFGQTVTDATAVVSYLESQQWFNFGNALGVFVDYVKTTVVDAAAQTEATEATEATETFLA